MTHMTKLRQAKKNSSRPENWSIAEAKARFSHLVEQAQSSGPQTITRHGKTAVVVVSAEEWSRRTRRSGNLAEFFSASPLAGSNLPLDRSSSTARNNPL